jgi:hypothetical protein
MNALQLALAAFYGLEVLVGLIGAALSPTPAVTKVETPPAIERPADDGWGWEIPADPAPVAVLTKVEGPPVVTRPEVKTELADRRHRLDPN